MRAGHADVLDELHINAHPIESLASFFGDGQIACPGGDDGDATTTLRRRLRAWQIEPDGSSQFVVLEARQHGRQSGRLQRVDA